MQRMKNIYWKKGTTTNENANHKNKHFNYRLSWRSKINYAIVESICCCLEMHWANAGRKKELRFTCCMIFFLWTKNTKIKWTEGSERTDVSTKDWIVPLRKEKERDESRKKMGNNIIYPLIIRCHWISLWARRCVRVCVPCAWNQIKWAKEKEAPNLATVSSSQFNET